MTFKALGLVGMAIAMATTPTVAHHSFAMFDAGTLITLEGTVKEFQWTNPHAWILLMVDDDEGKPVQWAIEMNGPSGLSRDGWHPKILTPGMKVKVVVHPLSSGKRGGQYLAITLPDGTQMGNPSGRVIGAGVRGSDAP